MFKESSVNRDKFQATMAKREISIVIILQLRHGTTTSRNHSLIGQLHVVNIICLGRRLLTFVAQGAAKVIVVKKIE